MSNRNLYTRLETSLRLREAGASQTKGGAQWVQISRDPPFLMIYPTGDYRVVAAAWRTDEIIAGLKDRGLTVDIFDVRDHWSVDACGAGTSLTRDHVSLVEALAQAWLAVLEEK